jgi:predicted phage tail protein
VIPEILSSSPDLPISSSGVSGVSVIATRPFTSEQVMTQAPEGLSISQILWNGPRPERLPYGLQVWIDGRPVPPEKLDWTYPKAGELVVVRALPQGGGNILRAVLMIAIMIVAIVAQQYWAPGAMIGIATGGGMGIGIPVSVAIAGASMAAMLAVNALIPPVAPKVDQLSSDQDSPTLWIEGARNTENRWGSVPVLLGKHRTVPFFGAKPFTKIADKDQTLFCLVTLGYGPQQITDCKMGETPVGNYGLSVKDGSLKKYPGYVNDDYTDCLIPNQVDEATYNIKLLSGVWHVRTTELLCDRAVITWMFPGGLVAIDDEGNKFAVTILMEMEYSVTGLGVWTAITAWRSIPSAQSKNLNPSYEWDSVNQFSVPASRYDYVCVHKRDHKIVVGEGTDVSILNSNLYKLARVTVNGDDITAVLDQRQVGTEVTGLAVTDAGGTRINIASGTVKDNALQTTAASTSPVRKNAAINFPSRGQYDIRVKRVTTDDDQAIPPNPNGHITLLNHEVYWIKLQSIKKEPPISFEKPLAQVEMVVQASDQLSGMIDDFNCIGFSICKDWDPGSSTWIERPTRNPASLYRHVLQHPANKKPYADAMLDLTWFQEFWIWCRDRKYTYNAIIASPRSVYEMCVEICSAGRATPQRLSDGRWAGIIDKERTLITGHYTPHNSWGFEFGGTYPEIPHAFRVQFLDEQNNWEESEAIVYQDGYNAGNATLFESVRQQGVTNHDQLWHLWRYNLACLKYRAFPFSFSVDWENLANTRGDLIRVTYYELSGASVFSGRLKAISEAGGHHFLTLDNKVTMEIGESYVVRIRLATGSTLTGNIITAAGETDVIEVNGLLATVPAAGDLFMFGEADEESKPAIIKSIEPLDKMCFKVNCIDYAPEVFATDSETPPAWTPNPRASIVPPVPEITNVLSDQSVMIRDPDGRFRLRIAVNYNIPSGKVAASEVQAQYLLVGGEEWITLDPVSVTEKVVYINDVVEGQEYQIKLRSIQPSGVSSDWSAATSHTVVGRILPEPEDLGYTTGPDESTPNKMDAYIEFYWDHLGEYDYLLFYRKSTSTIWTKIEIDGGNGEIDVPIFSGSGTLDLQASGEYQGATTLAIVVKIDGAGSPNTFRWSKNGGSTWEATGIAITGDWQELEDDILIKFSALTGGVMNDQWTMNAVPKTPVRYRIDGLQCGVTFRWKIRAVDRNGKKSKWIKPLTPAVSWAETPANVSFDDANSRFNVVPVLVWTPLAEEPHRYEIRSENANWGAKDSKHVAILEGKTTKFRFDNYQEWCEDQALTENQIRNPTFYIKARNKIGIYSAAADSIALQNAAPDMSGTTIKVMKVRTGSRVNYTVKWMDYAEPGDLHHYDVYYSTEATCTISDANKRATVGKGVKHKTFTGLSASAVFDFRVRPSDLFGGGTASN